MINKNNKNNLLLIFIAIALFLTIVILSILNLKKTTPTSSSSSLSTSQPPPPPSDRFQGELVCLPPDKTTPCVYGLLFEENYYRLDGLSQTLLVRADFHLGDQVTVLGEVNQDTIKVSSISAN